LRLRFVRRCASHSLLEIEAWMPSEIRAISPLTDRLMRLIEGSRCVAGDERAVQLALREALSNAVIHGNGMDAHKLVRIRCRCELGKGVSIIVTDSGQGFDEPSLGGFPALSGAVGQFLLKDVVLLGAAKWSLGEALTS
jgi:two-component sensor histidine kinase